MIWKVITLTVLLAVLADCQFEIDYGNDQFLMDGEPFQYISGSVHYYRIPRQYWRDRFRKAKAAGLNTISTYVEWMQHEPEPGKFDFSGDLNITEFIKTAEEEGLFVILRVGPYICSERTMGGFPYWLLRENPDVKLRVSDPSFTVYVERWLDVFLPYVAPFLFGNGGPIISVQVENEYGFYDTCDQDYTTWLGGVFKKYIGDKAILFTTDGSGFNSLSCGKIEGAYATIDFHPGANVTEMYLNQKAVEPQGPLVNSEFYAGWPTHWGEKWSTKNTDEIVKTLKDILDIGGSLNFYIFAGGSNFGFFSGSNYGPRYTPHVTSYDFDAPISEGGLMTTKYMAIRDFLLNYLSINTTLPDQSNKGNYGTVNLKNIAKLASPTVKTLLGRLVTVKNPVSFEDISQDAGFVLYETLSPISGGDLTLQTDARDLGSVYVNDDFKGVLSREQEINQINIDVSEGDRIGILVENGGRINFGGYNNDKKGLLSDVTLDVEILTSWNLTAYNFESLDKKLSICESIGDSCKSGPGFSIYTGTFTADVLSNIEYDGKVYPADTFLDMSTMTKGLVFVNGFNLGRYWSTRGPQYSLYVPGVYLNEAPALNNVVLIDESIDVDVVSVPFSETPIIGDPK